MISYASVPCKHVLQTPGHSGTALGKTEEHCIRNAVASLASPAFHQISEPQQRQAAMDGRRVHKWCLFHFRGAGHPQADFLDRQRESKTGTGKKEQKTTSVSQGGQSRQAAVNFELHGSVKDLMPLSSQGPPVQGQFLLWGTFYQKQKVLMSLRNQQPETSGKAGREASGVWRDRPSQQVSLRSDRPFPHRHC